MLGNLPGILNRLLALPLTENPLNIRCAISDLVADLDGLQIPFPVPMPERRIAYAAQLLDLLLGQEAYLACFGDLGGQLLFGAIDQMAGEDQQILADNLQTNAPGRFAEDG